MNTRQVLATGRAHMGAQRPGTSITLLLDKFGFPWGAPLGTSQPRLPFVDPFFLVCVLTCIFNQSPALIFQPKWTPGLHFGSFSVTSGMLGVSVGAPWATSQPRLPKIIKRSPFGDPFWSLDSMKFRSVSSVCSNMYFKPVPGCHFPAKWTPSLHFGSFSAPFGMPCRAKWEK